MELASGATGQLTVVMASPQTARQGWAIGDRGFIRYDLLTGTLERALPHLGDGYSRVLCDWQEEYEPMYAKEISAFLAAVRGEAAWPYSYDSAAVVCGTLAAAELSMLTGRTETVDPDRQPAALPQLRLRRVQRTLTISGHRVAKIGVAARTTVTTVEPTVRSGG